MSRCCARRLAAILGFALAAIGTTAWAQQPEQPPLALTGRIIFGVADYSQGAFSRGGPAVTLESDLVGYWRDPRILQFDVRPTITTGAVVPGTEMGNALTGFSGVGSLLQGSQFPFTISYSRTGSSFDETRSGTVGNQSVLSGVQIGTTNSVFDADWMLRFRHLPTLDLNYRDTDYSSELPKEFGVGDARNLRNFTAHLNYNNGGWQAGSWYQRTQSTVTFPNILVGGVQQDRNKTEDLGFNASRLLPLHSTLGASANQSKSEFNFDNLETNTTVRNANATLASQPVKRVSVTLQAQYTSNLQAFQEQLALAGADASSVGNPVPAGAAAGTPVPLRFLAAPFKVVTFSGGTGIQLGHGFSVNGSAGESHSSNSGTSTRWSAGLGYQRKWRSGWLATSYSRSQIATETDVVSEITTTGVVNPGQGTPLFIFFSEDINANTGTVNLNQDLPRQFRLATSAHVSEGTIKENGIPFPNHDYGGLVSLSRPVGEWTLTGSVSVDKNDANHELIYNESTAKGISLGAAYRGLSLSAGRQYGSGLALQVGDRLLFVSSPVLVGPLLGIPVLSSTTGTTVTGSYRSRRNRLELMGNWGHFNFTTDHLPVTDYNLLNLRASYRLRRLRLIAGFVKQSQLFSVGPLGTFNSRLVYFQVERVFRVF